VICGRTSEDDGVPFWNIRRISSSASFAASSCPDSMSGSTRRSYSSTGNGLLRAIASTLSMMKISESTIGGRILTTRPARAIASTRTLARMSHMRTIGST